MSDTSVFPIILIIERERGRLQGLTLKAELENRDNPKKLFCNDNLIYYQFTRCASACGCWEEGRGVVL